MLSEAFHIALPGFCSKIHVIGEAAYVVFVKGGTCVGSPTGARYRGGQRIHSIKGNVIAIRGGIVSCDHAAAEALIATDDSRHSYMFFVIRVDVGPPQRTGPFRARGHQFLLHPGEPPPFGVLTEMKYLILKFFKT